MGIARSTHYDRPEKAVDDTAIVEAMFAICDDFGGLLAITASGRRGARSLIHAR